MIVWLTCIAYYFVYFFHFLFFLFSFLSLSWSVLSVSFLRVALCSVCWASLFCCLCRFVSRFRFRVFRWHLLLQGILLFLQLFYYFMLLSFSLFVLPISMSSFSLAFSSCSFCFNMISCVLIFDFISTLSFTNIFPVSFSFCSCICRSLICWSLSDAWFILILSQFPNVLTTASNIFFSWLIFVISFSFCCSFCLSFWCCSFNW